MNTVNKYLRECKETYSLTEPEYIALLENVINKMNNNFINLFDFIINLCDQEIQDIINARNNAD